MPQLKYFFSCMLIAAMSSGLHISNYGDEMGLAQTTATLDTFGQTEQKKKQAPIEPREQKRLACEKKKEKKTAISGKPMNVSIEVEWLVLDVDNYDTIGRADVTLECKVGNGKAEKMSAKPTVNKEKNRPTWEWLG